MLLIGTPGLGEWAIILLILLLFFGKNRLPGLARSVGSGIHEFRKGISGQMDADEEESTEAEKESPKKVKSGNASESASKKKASAKSASKKKA